MLDFFERSSKTGARFKPFLREYFWVHRDYKLSVETLDWAASCQAEMKYAARCVKDLKWL